MKSASYSLGNRLLDALPPDDVFGLIDDLTIITLKAKQSTQSAGHTIHHIDFPIDAVLSVVATLKNGDTVEVGVVGSEGFVEAERALHSSSSSRTSFCQVEGRVGRMTSERFASRMTTSESFARAMQHNVRAVLFSAQQFNVCNLKHSVLERTARWLAMTFDRVGRAEFSLSREFLAVMLGADATAGSHAVDTLERSGAIAYNGSVVFILDKAILEGNACECYELTKDAFAQSLIL